MRGGQAHTHPEKPTRLCLGHSPCSQRAECKGCWETAAHQPECPLSLRAWRRLAPTAQHSCIHAHCTGDDPKYRAGRKPGESPVSLPPSSVLAVPVNSFSQQPTQEHIPTTPPSPNPNPESTFCFLYQKAFQVSIRPNHYYLSNIRSRIFLHLHTQ